MHMGNRPLISVSTSWVVAGRPNFRIVSRRKEKIIIGIIKLKRMCVIILLLKLIIGQNPSFKDTKVVMYLFLKRDFAAIYEDPNTIINR